jgi:hypothetical protein
MRRGELTYNVLSMFAPVLFALIAVTSIHPSNAYLVGIILVYLFGFVLFLIAKISSIKRGFLVSFGTKNMTHRNRVLYLVGIACMGIGGFSALLVLAFQNLIR